MIRRRGGAGVFICRWRVAVPSGQTGTGGQPRRALLRRGRGATRVRAQRLLQARAGAGFLRTTRLVVM